MRRTALCQYRFEADDRRIAVLLTSDLQPSKPIAEPGVLVAKLLEFITERPDFFFGVRALAQFGGSLAGDPHAASVQFAGGHRIECGGLLRSFERAQGVGGGDANAEVGIAQERGDILAERAFAFGESLAHACEGADRWGPCSRGCAVGCTRGKEFEASLVAEFDEPVDAADAHYLAERAPDNVAFDDIKRGGKP